MQSLKLITHLKALSDRGSFNVRVGSELHRKAALKASGSGISLNTLVEEAIQAICWLNIILLGTKKGWHTAHAIVSCLPVHENSCRIVRINRL